jgi:hypothetical protein
VLGATLLLVAWLTLSGRVALAQAGVAVAGVALAGSRLAQAGYASGPLSEAALYLDDYVTFLELLPQAVAARPTAPAPHGFQRLKVEGISFTYPSGAEPALRDISLEITQGEVVAPVGENGSGKTTLAKLLAGLYTPDAGRIHWDGVDINAVNPEELRRSVAVIFQDFLRYHLPARDNIGLGRYQAIDDLPAIRAPPTIPTPTGSSPSCALATTPCSDQSSWAAPTCRSASGSAWPWHVRSSATRPSSSSTSPPRRSTLGRSTTCSSASGHCSRSARSC